MGTIEHKKDGKPTRKSPRLTTYDYSQFGAYFITICTKNKEKTLSRICRGDPCGLPLLMHTDLGRIVKKELEDLEKYFPIKICNSVIMPNHVHLLFEIEARQRAAARTAPTVSLIVGGFKSRVSNQWLKLCKINNKQMGQIFQRSYHDHIIRDRTDYDKIWNYIGTNPQRWERDCFYTEGNEEQK